ncbi:MAG: biopolymer transporter ExbD [Chromatiales bacterium]
MILRKRHRQKPIVNLTPLIDVVFLLLIFFMVSTTFDTQSRIKITLPEVETDIPEDEFQDRILVQIAADGSMSLNNSMELVSSTPTVLKRAMAEIAEGRTDIPVIVKVDRNAPFQAAMTVMDVSGQLGLTEITFPGRKTVKEE